MHLDASLCERRRGHLGSDFKARFCLTGNVTHRDVKLQSGRRDSVAAEWRYRSSLLRSHILSDSHVVSRATCWEQKLEEKKKSNDSHEIDGGAFWCDGPHKTRTLGCTSVCQCKRPTSRLPREIYENSWRIGRTNYYVSAATVNGK